jgi:hypothetical protein
MPCTLRAWLSVALLVVICQACWADDDPQATVRTSAQRAVKWLTVEVPKWRQENRCYSCHNNGDAFRALVRADQTGLLPNRQPLTDTLAFLAAPNKWDANGPDGPFKDVKLARIQFAAALTDAASAKLIDDRRALAEAAALVAELQQDDGTWPSDAPGTLGSPVTYGQALATAMAIHTLRAARRDRYQPHIDRAIAWFTAREPQSVLDASATLLALAEETPDAAARRRSQALAVLKSGHSDNGGCGPFVNSPPDVVDTALAVIALSRQSNRESLAPLIAAGRAYLIAQQQADGSWPPTTRPPGADSYAQQSSTTAWALQALLP